jgi:hypothetical protein
LCGLIEYFSITISISFIQNFLVQNAIKCCACGKNSKRLAFFFVRLKAIGGPFGPSPSVSFSLVNFMFMVRSDKEVHR